MPTFAERLRETTQKVNAIQKSVTKTYFENTRIPQIDSYLSKAAQQGHNEYKLTKISGEFDILLKEYYESPSVGLKVTIVADGVIFSW